MEINKLRCLYWNIHGISSKTLGDKNDNTEFLDIISSYDVICLSELHTDKTVSIPGFHLKKQKFRPKKHKGPKIGGGIAVYISLKLANNFRLMQNENNDSIWIRSLGTDETILGFYYCSPDYGDSNFFEIVNNEIETFNNGKSTFIFGDFNARTKIVCENILHDKYDDDLGINSELQDLPLPRNSEDMKLVNKRGKEFLDICRINDLTVANGRTLGDLFGKYTCHQKLGSSVVDYLMTPTKTLQNLLEFRVGDLHPLLSDHCPIVANIQLNKVLKCEEEQETQMLALPDKFIWDHDSTVSFTQRLASDDCRLRAEALLNKGNLKMEDIKSFLTDTATASEIKKTKSRRKRNKDKPWFNKECSDLKKEIILSGKHLRSDPNNVSIREKLYVLKRKLRNAVRRNKTEYKKAIINEMCSDLSNKQKKEYWNGLRKLEGKRDEHKYISDFTLVNHFKELLFDDKIKLQFEGQDKKNKKGSLDYPIDLDELKLATKILKNGKGTGIDVICNEMLGPLISLYPKLVLRAFNEILEEHGVISKDWLLSLVSAIHKKGAKEDPDNYRGISLMSCLGKLFLTIINNRLTKFSLAKGLISPSELGFVQGNRTSDPHIILQNLVRKYCHKRGSRLYGCFVDFSKAFDCVPRDILIKKLQERGIDGKVLEIIKTLYLEDTASVKVGNTYSVPFKTNRGVRQGCVLSPLLFILFLSDLQEILDKTKDNVKLDNETEISCIMWADDILILSETEEGLQRKLDSLGTYAKANKLTVNTKKTQCMIFNKTGRLLRNYKFTYNNAVLECVREYKYLGFLVTPSGEIVSGLKDLRNRAMKALAKMRKSLGMFFQHSISNTIHLYTYVIRPILLYCCDFWGCLKLPKNNPIERFHTMFCKSLLGVRKQTNNEAVLQELGLLPISIHATKIAMRNWERIHDKKANMLLIASHYNAFEENLPWTANVKDIFAHNGLLETYISKVQQSSIPNANEEINQEVNESMANVLLERLVDQYNQTSFGSIQTSNKLHIFSQIKKEPGRETYLSEVIPKHRRAMTKLRMSSHSLEIERGRYDKTEPQDRVCKFCQILGRKEVENEAHFVIKCPQYSELREKYLPSNILDDRHLNEEEKLIKMLFDMDNCKSIAKFIYQAFEDREIGLEVLASIQDMVERTEKTCTANPSSPNEKTATSNSYVIKSTANNGMKITLARVF